MADETVTLTFLAEQGRRILDELLQARTEREIVRTDNRRVLSELASNRAAMAGLTTEMTAMRGTMAGFTTEFTIMRGEIAIVRGELGTIRDTMGAILTELRELRVQNASYDDRLRHLEETRG